MQNLTLPTPILAETIFGASGFTRTVHFTKTTVLIRQSRTHFSRAADRKRPFLQIEFRALRAPPNLCPKIITAVAIFPLLLRRFRGCKITDSPPGYYPTKGEREDTRLVQLSPQLGDYILGF